MAYKKRGLIVVVFALFFLFVASAFAADGCYLNSNAGEDIYCVSGVSEEVAKADCEKDSGCTFSDEFKEGVACNSLDECKPVTCSIDCKEHALGKCEQLGGKELSTAEEEVMCTPGCCVWKDSAGLRECNFNMLEAQCKAIAATKSGVEVEGFYPGVGFEGCGQVYCKELEKGSLTGFVKDGENIIVSGAEVVLVGKNKKVTTKADGSYAFTEVQPGSYLVEVSKEGFQKASAAVVVDIGKKKEQDFIIKKIVLAATVSFTTKDKSGKELGDVTISWKGPATDKLKTDIKGEGSTTFPAGTYTFTASKPGYVAAVKSLEVIKGTYAVEFVLKKGQATIYSGTTYIDFNSNGKIDKEEARYGVELVVDGVPRIPSQYPGGKFVIELIPEKEHTLTATYQGFSYGPEKFTLKNLEKKEQELLLIKKIGDCSVNGPTPQKAVSSFSVLAVPGEKKLRLDWQQPCPEVSGYEITKKEKDGQEKVLAKLTAITSYVDSEVEWGKVYEYLIKAIYLDGGNVRSSEKTTISSEAMDEVCEGKYHKPKWETFCVSSAKNSVFTCNNKNQKQVALQCDKSVCAPAGQGKASCKEATQCLSGGLFGLSYTKSACYGKISKEGDTQNYCTFDYTNTIANSCKSCNEIQDCFEYKSKDACQINSCLTQKCKWVDAAANTDKVIDYSNIFKNYDSNSVLVTPELGAGYCVQENYQKEDKCSLCSGKAGLFENFYCTAEVCSSLGKCFSNPPGNAAGALSQCNECGGEVPSKAANCYSYTSQLECEDGSSVAKNDLGKITSSADSCGWGRCKWTGSSCIKDGDANTKDDCEGLSGSALDACRIDTTPPVTSIINNFDFVLSTTKTNITFSGSDSYSLPGQSSTMKSLQYCLSNAGKGAADTCSFKEKKYKGVSSSETIVLNGLKEFSKPVSGAVYKLKFASLDKYNNLEDVQEAFVYVDTTLPDFEINEKEEAKAEAVDLTVYLEKLNENMACKFTLKPMLPVGTDQVVDKKIEEKKEVTFSGLKGVRYDLVVECNDAFGNSNSKKKSYVFEQNKQVQIVAPALKDAVAATTITFKVDTKFEGECGLFTADNQKIGQFTADSSFKKHTTSPIPGFVEGEYAATHKVICTNRLTQEKAENYFHFIVDFTPPKTTILLKEGVREETPTKFNWEESFIKTVDVSLTCKAEGFDCDKTKYCLGKGCEFKAHKNYQEYKEALKLTETTRICYHSSDKGGNEVIQPDCGTIVLDGYGVTLERPPGYFYQGELWGVSNKPVFDVQFTTKVPASVCKIGLTPSFDYNDVVPERVLQNQNGKFIFKNWPGLALKEYSKSGSVKKVYVQCEANKELSPVHTVNLEYDPSAPEITDAFADPAKVLEGTKTGITVKTDDKTLCKFDEYSEGMSYDTMKYSFPGIAENVMDVTHSTTYAFNFIGVTKKFELGTQCINGAHDSSKVEKVSFTVDYAALGNIIKAYPRGEVFKGGNVTLHVETSKTAKCDYEFDSGFKPLGEGIGKVHRKVIGGIKDGSYFVPVLCKMGDHTAKTKLSFTIDTIAPEILAVEDGNFSCGSSYLNVMVSSNEKNLSNYYYEVYDGGPTTYVTSNVSTKTITGVVYNGSAGSELPVKVPTTNLQDGHKYYTKVWGWDQAGNKGGPTQSNGIVIVKANNSVCEQNEGGPSVEVIVNSSLCTSAFARLECTDDLGCKDIVYGTHGSSKGCNATSPYGGKNIVVDESSWLCYTATDYAGKNSSGTKLISFDDKDGDGIADFCDLCKGSLPGTIVDSTGCADTQLTNAEAKIDSDGDQLPDTWENIFSRSDCPLNPKSKDSDGNGIEDGTEDYDKDGRSTYEEYLSGTDPCESDKAPEFPSSDTKKTPTLPTTIDTGGDNFVAWLLLIIGVVMILGGTGYLIYYYKYKEKPRAAYRPSAPVKEKPKGIVSLFSQPFKRIKKKDRSRESVFSAFSKNDAKIPHVDSALNKGSPEAVHSLAKKYVARKSEIEPGLRQGEKGVFAKLEQIAGSKKVTKKGAQDIFSKLREIAKKRKEK